MKKLIFLLMLIGGVNLYAQLTPLARTGDISDSLSAYTTNVVEPALNDTADVIRAELAAAIGEVNLTTLPSAQIFVGNGSGVATAVALTGDISITNAGVSSIVAGSIVNADLNASAALDATKIANGTVTSTEFQYIGGLTSDAQTQISAITTLANGKIYMGNGSNVATEVTPSGDATISNAGVIDLTDASVLAITKAHGNSFSIPIPYPQTDETFLLTQMENAYTISSVTALIMTDGGGEESVLFNLYENATAVFSGNQTADAYTTTALGSQIGSYDVYTSFSNSGIASTAYLSVKFGTVTGTVNQIIITVFYTED